MKKTLLLLLFLSTQIFAQTPEEISNTLQMEWNRLRSHIETIQADGDIGGYMNYKEYGAMTLLWRTSENKNDNEVIRFYIPREDDLKSFAVTYHKSHSIIDGRIVLRRFVGTEPTGWINHTIDYQTGEYLGEQGFFPYSLRENELRMMEEWNITLFGKDL